MTVGRAGDRRRPRRAAGSRGRRGAARRSPDDARRWPRDARYLTIRRGRGRRRARPAPGRAAIPGTRAPTRCIDAYRDATGRMAAHADDAGSTIGDRRARTAGRDRPASGAIWASCCAGGRRAPTRRAALRALRAGTAALRRARAPRERPRGVVGSGRGTWWEQTHLRRAVRGDRPTSSSPGLHGAAGARRAAGRDHPRRVVRRASRSGSAPREGRAAPAADAPGGARRVESSSPTRSSRAAEIVERLRSIAPSASGSIPPGVTRRAGPRQRRRAREPLVLFVGSLFNRRRLPDDDHRVRARRPRRVPTRGWSSPATTAAIRAGPRRPRGRGRRRRRASSPAAT